MARMLIHSDNAATDMLIRNLGGPAKIQEWLRQRNITGIRIDRNIADLLAAKRDLWDVRDSSSPKAMVELLRRIDNGTLLKPQSKDYLLRLMAQCATGRNRMKAMLPYGTRVEHKTGTLNNYSSDVGFITLPNGRRLAVAFFARAGSNRPQTIATAAKAIYDGFVYYLRQPFTVSFGSQYGTP
jgi:beta-lactamase class A